MLKSRRGLLAAGLAVAVVGALGVASTMNAGAEQVPGDQGAKAPVADQSEAVADSTPPALLPWGDKPQRSHRGKAGTSSRALKAQGFQAAANDNTHTLDFAPKGRSTRTTVLRSEKTDVQPPAPPASPSTDATTTAPADPTTAPATTTPTTSPATTPSTTPATTTPAASPTSAQVAPLAATSAAAVAASTTPPVTGNNGVPSKNVSFLYSVASQEVTADGLYASIDIKKPTLAKGEYHTLAELAVQSDDGAQTVELGWNVDRAVNGDDDPHLFVFHWVNGVPTCYNTCDFKVADGASAKPGDTLPVDTLKKFGIEHVNNAWWIAYDTGWVGSFPDSVWINQGVDFTQGEYFQAFGEVAAPSPWPCSQMGSGVKVTADSGAARMGNLTYVNGPTVNMYMRSTNGIYGMASIKGSTRSFAYGGPGSSDPQVQTTDTIKAAC